MGLWFPLLISMVAMSGTSVADADRLATISDDHHGQFLTPCHD